MTTISTVTRMVGDCLENGVSINDTRFLYSVSVARVETTEDFVRNTCKWAITFHVRNISGKETFTMAVEDNHVNQFGQPVVTRAVHALVTISTEEMLRRIQAAERSPQQ